MAQIKLQADGLNLADTFAFTGTVTGAGGGKLLQVINAVTSTESVISTDTWTDSGLTADITPASTSSKILIFANCTGTGKASSSTYGKFRLLRDASNIVANFEERCGSDGGTGANKVGSVSVNYLDSPSTTSSTTYKVQLMSGADSSYAQMGNSASKSTITLMEISA